MTVGGTHEVDNVLLPSKQPEGVTRAAADDADNVKAVETA